MHTVFIKKLGLILSVTLCCAGMIYFYPFLSSSIIWMGNSHFRYENRTEVKLPFRWITGDGGGLVLVKPAATIMSYMRRDSRLSVSDHGPNFKPDDEGRARAFHAFRFAETRGTPDELTYPFTSAGLLCSPINKKTTKPSDMLFILCSSSDSRYFIQFMGREDDVSEASEIVKQVLR